MENICKCNNCGSFLYDENPQTDTLKIDVSNLNVPILPMEQINQDGDTFWGCGNCQTDGYLMDIDSIDKIMETQLIDRLVDSELLAEFNYKDFTIKTYYIGTDNVGYKIFLGGELIQYGDDYKPSFVHNQDDPEVIISLVDYILFNQPILPTRIEKFLDRDRNESDIVLMISDFYHSDDEDFLCENGLEYAYASRIRNFITRA